MQEELHVQNLTWFKNLTFNFFSGGMFTNWMVTEHKMGLFITTSGQAQHSLDLTKHVTTSLDKYTVSDLTTHTHCHANNLKALNKRQKINQNEVSFYHF